MSLYLGMWGWGEYWVLAPGDDQIEGITWVCNPDCWAGAGIAGMIKSKALLGEFVVLPGYQVLVPGMDK